jgi:hypothetical protein
LLCVPFVHTSVVAGSCSSGSIRAFCTRAIAKANKKQADVFASMHGARSEACVLPVCWASHGHAYWPCCQGSAATAGGSVADLIREVRSEKAKVHVDLAGRVALITLKDLPAVCLPSSVIADKAANLLVKLKEETRVERPFLYMDLAQFAPDWTEEACMQLCLAAGGCNSHAVRLPRPATMNVRMTSLRKLRRRHYCACWQFLGSVRACLCSA